MFLDLEAHGCALHLHVELSALARSKLTTPTWLLHEVELHAVLFGVLSGDVTMSTDMTQDVVAASPIHLARWSSTLHSLAHVICALGLQSTCSARSRAVLLVSKLLESMDACVGASEGPRVGLEDVVLLHARNACCIARAALKSSNQNEHALSDKVQMLVLLM